MDTTTKMMINREEATEIACSSCEFRIDRVRKSDDSNRDGRRSIERRHPRRQSTIDRLSRHNYSVLALIIVSIFWISPVDARRSYTNDCSANNRLQCRVTDEEGACANSTTRSDDYPAAPFDLRVSWFMVATTPGKLDTYQLWVNVSWKPTYEKSINKTEGFELIISDKDHDRQDCFTFKLNQPQWENSDRHTSIRFQFSTIDVFNFGHNYYIEIHSLPRPSIGITPKRNTYIGRDVAMPVHPEQFLLEQLNRTGYFDSSTSQLEAITAHCNPTSSSSASSSEMVVSSREHGSGAHPQASKWVAAFRYVYIQPKAKFIFVDFVAAPPQYCFEEYELRLLRNMHEIVDHTRVRRGDLNYETHGNVSVAFGNHTFHNVTPGVYEIGVIPIDHSAMDLRCLCPSFGRSCTCAQAVWPDVVMPDPPKLIEPSNPCDHMPPLKFPYDCPTVLNTTKPPLLTHGNNDESNMTGTVLTLAILLVGALILLVAGLVLLRFFYKRHKEKVSAARMYLLPMMNTKTTEFDLRSNNNFDDDGYSGGSAATATELTRILHPVKVLIIYARDCPAHEAAVRALSEYMRTRCVCDVTMDSTCLDEIDANKFDWAYKSIAEADRVLLINSYGAYLRYQAKLMADANTMVTNSTTNGHHVRAPSTIVERGDASPFDDLFLLQLDLITQFQHRDPNMGTKFVSVRFEYTPPQFVLPHANPHIRYEIPRHLRPIVIDLHKLHSSASASMIDDDNFLGASSLPPRLREVNDRDYDQNVDGQRLKQCITAMERFVQECPDWFEKLHVRRPVMVSPIPKPLISSPIKQKHSSTSPTRTNGYIVVAPPTIVADESPLPPCIEPSSWSQPTKPESTADSGYDEPEATTSSSIDRIHHHHSPRVRSSTMTDVPNHYDYRVPSQVDTFDYVAAVDPSECLMTTENEIDEDHQQQQQQFVKSSSQANMDSCDSGIASDFLQSTSSSSDIGHTSSLLSNGNDGYKYFSSPKTGPRSNGLIISKNGTTAIARSPNTGKKFVTPPTASSAEVQRLIC